MNTMHVAADNITTATTKATIQLRLHLVRHGETVANSQNNVIGQSDSVRFLLKYSFQLKLESVKLLYLIADPILKRPLLSVHGTKLPSH